MKQEKDARFLVTISYPEEKQTNLRLNIQTLYPLNKQFFDDLHLLLTKHTDNDSPKHKPITEQTNQDKATYILTYPKSNTFDIQTTVVWHPLCHKPIQDYINSSEIKVVQWINGTPKPLN
jgi:hypothetical protein